jgi:hypothetical protein
MEPGTYAREAADALAPRDFDCQAAQKENDRIQIENSGKGKVAPIAAGSLTDNKLTGKCGERHGNCGDGDPDAAQSGRSPRW